MKTLTVFQRNPWVMGLAFAAAAATVFISEASYWRSAGTLQELSAMGAARTQIQVLERSMLDAETGQRGYLLTHRKEYLEPYAQALLRIEEAYRVLDAYYGNDPESQALLQRLHDLTETKLSELALTLRLNEEGRGKAGQEILMTDIGREKMDAIRATSAELLEYQTRAVSASRAELDVTLALGRFGVALLSAISLLALFFYLRQSQALKLQQMELQRVVQLERDRLEVEVTNRTAELIELAQHLQTAREDERQRLARNLHDELGSLLTSAKLDAARIKSRLANTAPEALELLAHLVGTLNTGIALGRRIIEDLRPSSLSNLGLVATLEILAREYAAQSGVAVHCQLEPVPLRPSAELVVYRLVQEAITNITKYAQARNVWIELCSRAGQVEVSVRDDGLGFDTGTKPQSAYGLVGMRFRVGAEGGSLHLQSRPGQGTQILARLPQHTPPPA
ncbi:CHASE3 domain-containing protein [Rhodoferax sp. TS-BS-61-7]|uniref:CHASE3 domain-containing protein n=1 Tax=Rhodoferax sp. TS-BS-61-7 TaxID=2094194 RepID=UPI001F471226|nr:CHASE3 domain-containing protein [Rhodoferax sp. TS-BS-61-7]